MKRIIFYLSVALGAFLLGIFGARLAGDPVTHGEMRKCTEKHAGREHAVHCNPFTNDDTDAVYWTVLQQPGYAGKSFLIESRTIASSIEKDHINSSRNFADASESAITDYTVKNKRSVRIRQTRFTGSDHLLANDEKLREIFSEGMAGWRRFKNEYPKRDGVLYFSRVGFNADRTEAIVYVGSNCGPSCGNIRLFTLEKVGSSCWRVPEGK